MEVGPLASRNFLNLVFEKMNPKQGIHAEDYPASALVQVGQLASEDLMIEIEAVAVLD